jgi:hypothetical protein
MDTLHGSFSGENASEDQSQDYGYGEDEVSRETPPLAIGQDERRMQVRAYNFWASLLADRSFPSIEDLDPDNLPDFGPHSVLLDFTSGIEDPAVTFLGPKLAQECGTEGLITKLSDVPSRSLLSRITDHYLQIIANQAPIGFEAEFVNQRGATIMYRGILLPFSSDDDTIDFIYGVINWKELADQETTDELLNEINQALAAGPEVLRQEDALPEWADGPMEAAWADTNIEEDVLDLVTPFDASEYQPTDWDEPAFGSTDAAASTDEDTQKDTAEIVPVAFGTVDSEPAFEDTLEAEPQQLADWLASARELAYAAQGSEDRSRQALYAAISRAYDFSLAAGEDPAGLEELLADAGLKAQERAPLTPVVKLVFGADYDKTRLAEFSTVLAHAQRLGLSRGTLAKHLAGSAGGLKGAVSLERQLRAEELAKPVSPRQAPKDRLARKLRKLGHQPLDHVSSEGSEFTLLVARRLPDGQVVLLGEVGDDTSLLERAARKLLV